MEENNEISTPIAFINGSVEVNGIPDISNDQVYIQAQPGAGGNSTATNILARNCKPEAGQKYSLTVAPGDWTVWAQCGPVMSTKTKVNVASGKSVEVDFSFGVDKD